jgi:N-acetyl-gamma-glutamyl-phosphate reductase
LTISAAVIGASGYAGGELLRILVSHPKAKPEAAYDIKNVGRPVHQIHPNLRGSVELTIDEPNYDEISGSFDVVFVATPHGVAMNFMPKLLEGGAKVVDLSADYRFDDIKVFEKYYIKHENPQLKAIYGLPELYREKIKQAKFVANPGCYPTAAILGLAPLLKAGIIDLEHVVIDAKSGTSGAGAKPSEALHHPVCAENLMAYNATSHRHGPEINQELSKLAGKKMKAHFTPHLVPMVRGILCTMHVFVKKSTSKKGLLDMYQKSYQGERFVRVLDDLPQTAAVVGSNFCDIGLEAAAGGKRLVVGSVIDNLVKGASGQAVQNMNLMFKMDESTGLEVPVPYP